MAGIEAACSESSSPWPKPKIAAFRRSLLNSVRLKMPLSGLREWQCFLPMANSVVPKFQTTGIRHTCLQPTK